MRRRRASGARSDPTCPHVEADQHVADTRCADRRPVSSGSRVWRILASPCNCVFGNPDWTPHSAWIDFETKHSIGQIRAWDRGDVDVEFGFLETSEIRPPVHREIALASELECILDTTLQEAIDEDRLRTLLIGIVAGDTSMATARELEGVLATGFSNDGRFADLGLALLLFALGAAPPQSTRPAWLAPAAATLATLALAVT